MRVTTTTIFVTAAVAALLFWPAMEAEATPVGVKVDVDKFCRSNYRLVSSSVEDCFRFFRIPVSFKHIKQVRSNAIMSNI